jgi:hypothetical protein
MINSNQTDQEFLQPKDKVGLFRGLIYVGKVFSEHSWPNLEAVLKDRLTALRNIDENHSSYIRRTYLAIVLFFSYTDAAALSTKRLLSNARKQHLLQSISKKQRTLLEKDADRIGFEDLMKIQFSILPHSLGAPREYGTVKQMSLPHLFKLREIRNSIVHPNGLGDLIGVDVTRLGGKDINIPMAEYMTQLQRTLASCAKRLAPPETRNNVDLVAWLQKREFDLE